MPSQGAGGSSELCEFDGLPAHTRVWIGGHDLEGKRIAHRRSSAAQRPATGPIDLAVITPRSVDEAVYFADKLRDRLAPGAAIWILRRERSAESEHATGETLRSLSAALTKLGLMETGVSSIEEEYEIVRFTSARREASE